MYVRAPTRAYARGFTRQRTAGSTSRPTTAVTLGNLLQRPPTAMNGGAGLSLPPSFGGVRNALDREGLGARDAGGGGSHGEEPQILRLD